MAFGTRDALVQTAESLMRTKGNAAFSYAELAETVGIRKASIHQQSHQGRPGDCDRRVDMQLKWLEAVMEQGMERGNSRADQRKAEGLCPVEPAGRVQFYRLGNQGRRSHG